MNVRIQTYSEPRNPTRSLRLKLIAYRGSCNRCTREGVDGFDGLVRCGGRKVRGREGGLHEQPNGVIEIRWDEWNQHCIARRIEGRKTMWSSFEVYWEYVQAMRRREHSVAALDTMLVDELFHRWERIDMTSKKPLMKF